MNAEIITIGTELILGQIVDSNAAYLAQQLAAVGLNLNRKTSVGDDQDLIAAAVQDALGRCQVVLCSGGLGPTADDITREAIAKATGRQLVLYEGLLAQIEAFFARRGLPLGENSRRQAFIPEGALPLENSIGTAPGFIIEDNDQYVIALPGVPREMRHLTETLVVPFLREQLGLHAIIKVRVLRTVGLPESQLDQLIDDLERETNPMVGLCAHPGQVDIRVTARANNEAEAEALIAVMEAHVRERLGDVVFGIDNDTLEALVGELLETRQLTIAVVETNSGGAVTQRLTRTPTGQAALRESFIAGDAQALSRHLDLLIEDSELVSQRTAIATAQAVRWLTGADLGLAIIGDTDPTVNPYGERTGRTYMALAMESKTIHKELWVGGTSDMARAWVSNWALDSLRTELKLPC